MATNSTSLLSLLLQSQSIPFLLEESRADTISRYDCLPVIEDAHTVVSLSDSLNVMEDSISNRRTLYGAIDERGKGLHSGLIII